MASARPTISDDQWAIVVSEVLKILVDLAKAGDVISYANLAKQIQTTKVEPNERFFFSILDQISLMENVKGRGMLSALVIKGDEHSIPGRGFFYLAKKLGKSTQDREQFWKDERDHIYKSWGGDGPAGRPTLSVVPK